MRLCPDEWILELLEDASNVEARDRLRDPVERLQWSHAQKLLSLGVSVFLKNGFWSRTERISFAQNAALPGAEVELYYLTTPKEELWRRLEIRNQTFPPGSFPVTRK